MSAKVECDLCGVTVAFLYPRPESFSAAADALEAHLMTKHEFPPIQVDRLVASPRDRGEDRP